MEECWTSAAKEFLAHFGKEAAGVAARRADELARRGDWRGADRALLLLSGVERLDSRVNRGADHA